MKNCYVNKYRTIPIWFYKYIMMPVFTLRKWASIALFSIAWLVIWLANLVFPELEHRIVIYTTIEDAEQYYKTTNALFDAFLGEKGGKYDRHKKRK